MFGVSRQRPSRAAARRMEQIARRHGATMIEGTFPGDGYKRWFAGPNMGAPFDQAMSKAVYDDLAAAGIIVDDESGDLAPQHVAKR